LISWIIILIILGSQLHNILYYNGYDLYFYNNSFINNTIITQIKKLLINSGYNYLYDNLEYLDIDNAKDRDILLLINKIVNSKYNAILETTPNSLGGINRDNNDDIAEWFGIKPGIYYGNDLSSCLRICKEVNARYGDIYDIRCALFCDNIKFN
jgi:hypothetical protein